MEHVQTNELTFSTEAVIHRAAEQLAIAIMRLSQLFWHKKSYLHCFLTRFFIRLYPSILLSIYPSIYLSI
jgi:hypothetical protein